MALIKCPECGKEISDQATSCPNCGRPIIYNRPQINYNVNAQTQAPNSSAAAPAQKKESPLGIAGMLISLLFCFPLFPIVGLILCAIALKDNKHKSVCGIIGIVISLITLVISVVINFGPDTNTGHTPSSNIVSESTSRPTSTPKPDTYITMDEFNAIESGMSYNEVVEIVGCEGTLMSSVDLMGINTSIYCWYGKDKISNANVTFQDDAVMGKAQIGLD